MHLSATFCEAERQDPLPGCVSKRTCPSIYIVAFTAQRLDFATLSALKRPTMRVSERLQPSDSVCRTLLYSKLKTPTGDFLCAKRESDTVLPRSAIDTLCGICAALSFSLSLASAIILLVHCSMAFMDLWVRSTPSFKHTCGRLKRRLAGH